MLTVTEPLRLRCGGGLPLAPDALGERIRGGYGPAAARLPAAQLVFLPLFPPQPPAAPGSTALVLNSRCMESASLVLNMAAHVVNRIIAAETGWFTRRDQTCAFSVLNRSAAAAGARLWTRVPVLRQVERHICFAAAPLRPAPKRLTGRTRAGLCLSLSSPEVSEGEKDLPPALRPVPERGRFVLPDPDAVCLLREVHVLRREGFHPSGKLTGGARPSAGQLPAGPVPHPAAAAPGRCGGVTVRPPLNRTAGCLFAVLPVFPECGSRTPAEFSPKGLFHWEIAVISRPAVWVRDRLRLCLDLRASPGDAPAEAGGSAAPCSGGSPAAEAPAAPRPPARAADIRRLTLREQSVCEGHLLRNFSDPPGRAGQSAGQLWTAPPGFSGSVSSAEAERAFLKRFAAFRICTRLKTAPRQGINRLRMEKSGSLQPLIREKGIPAFRTPDAPRRNPPLSARAFPQAERNGLPPRFPAGSPPAAERKSPAAFSGGAPQAAPIPLHVRAAVFPAVRETLRQSGEFLLRSCPAVPGSTLRPAVLPGPERRIALPGVRGGAAPNAPAEMSPAPAETEAGSAALLERLAEIDRRNRALLKTVQETRRQSASAEFRGADISRTLQESLRILETPHGKEPPPPAETGTARSARSTPWEELILRAADPAARTLYGALLARRENPEQISERGLLRPAGMAALRASLRDAASPPPERADTGMPGACASFGMFRTEEAAALPAPSRQTPAVRPRPQAAETHRERASLVHRQTVPGMVRELPESSERQGLKALPRTELPEETICREQRRTEWSETRLETGTKTTEDISDLVKRTVARQMRSISDQVYRQMERRLQAERARRGRL